MVKLEESKDDTPFCVVDASVPFHVIVFATSSYVIVTALFESTPKKLSKWSSMTSRRATPFKNTALSRDTNGISIGKFGSHLYVAASNTNCGLVAVLSN